MNILYRLYFWTQIQRYAEVYIFRHKFCMNVKILILLFTIRQSKCLKLCRVALWWKVIKNATVFCTAHKSRDFKQATNKEVARSKCSIN